MNELKKDESINEWIHFVTWWVNKRINEWKKSINDMTNEWLNEWKITKWINE